VFPPYIVLWGLGVGEVSSVRVTFVQFEPSHQSAVLCEIDDVLKVIIFIVDGCVLALQVDLESYHGRRAAMQPKLEDPPKGLASRDIS